MISGLYACATVPTSEVVDDLKANASLTQFYQQRSATTLSQYWSPSFLGNIAEYYRTTTPEIHFADQTVYLGFYTAWQSLAALNDPSAASLTNLNAAITHLLDHLVIVTQVDGSPNTGYFMRDDMSSSQVNLDGVQYSVSSDDLSGTDDEQSQDQIIHILFGYRIAAQVLPRVPGTAAAQLLAKIVAHAHDIGLRLKANNYMVLTPTGEPVARGNDARPLAWPIAAAISNITGKPLDTYLDGVDVPLSSKNKTLHFSNEDLHALYGTALKLITAGLCDLKYGDNHEDLCPRFTLALINSLYVSSGSYAENPAYIQRMDKDGDYIYAAAAHALRHDSRVPKAYYQQLTSALDAAFTNVTAPELWCQDNRWVRMPASCPSGTTLTTSYNALDFLSYYQVMLNLEQL